MQAVVQRGTGRAPGSRRPAAAAGKSGTSSENRDAWFVGYTPQLSTAVWIGYKTPQTIVIDDVEVTGGGFASPIWKAYTDGALAGQPVLEFPEPVYAGRGSGRQDAPSPGRGRRGPRSPRPRRRRSSRPRRPSRRRSSPSRPPRSLRRLPRSRRPAVAGRRQR
jgi:membrane peptidoglycan carboxypeptidase